MMDLLFLLGILAVVTRAGMRVLAYCRGLSFRSRLEGLLFSCAVGYGSTAYLVLALGAMGLLRPFVAWAVLAALALTAIAGRGWKAVLPVVPAGRAAERSPLSLFEIGVIAVWAAFISINFVNSAVPTMNHDTLREYFLFPRVWLQHGGRPVDVPRFFTDQITLITELMGAFGMLLRGEVLAQMLTGFGMGILCSLAVFLFARLYFPRSLALLAATIFYSSRIIVWISSSGKVNLCLGFFEIMALYGLFRRWETGDGPGKRRWLLLSAAMCGFALSTHTAAVITTGIIGAFFFFGMVWAERAGFRRAAGECILFGCAAGVAGSPLYLKNWFVMGNPVYPKLLSVFGGEYHGVDPGLGLFAWSGLGGFVRILWYNTMEAWRNISQPPSPLLLAFVPGLLLLTGVHRRVKVMLLYGFVFLIPWYLLCQRNRYALTVMCVLSIAAAYVFHSSVGRRRAALSVALPLALLVSFRGDIADYARSGLVSRDKLLCALHMESYDTYLDRETRRDPLIPNYAMCRFINEHLPSGAKIFAVHDEYLFRMQKPYLCAREPRGEEIMWMRDEGEVLRALKEEGVTHVLYNDKFVPAINAWFRKINLFERYMPEDNVFSGAAFRERHFRLLYRDGEESLYEVEYPT